MWKSTNTANASIVPLVGSQVTQVSSFWSDTTFPSCKCRVLARKLTAPLPPFSASERVPKALVICHRRGPRSQWGTGCLLGSSPPAPRLVSRSSAISENKSFEFYFMSLSKQCLPNVRNALVKALASLLNICAETFYLTKRTCLLGHSFPQLLFYLFYLLYFNLILFF